MGFPKGQKRDFKGLQRRRLRAAGWFDKGLAPAEVARRCGVSCQSATRWQKAWLEGGKQALQKTTRPGRPARLNQEEIAALQEALKEGPGAHGFATELWTAQRVTQVIQNRFGVRYHPDHVCRLLGQMGWSCQRPTTRALQRDESAIRRWKRFTWPNLKKKP